MIDLVATSDSGIVLLMHERQFTRSDKLNLKLVKLDKYGNQPLGSNIKEPIVTSFKIYPNPTFPIVNLEFENIDRFSQAIFHNIQGQKVASFNIESQKNQTLDISILAKGIYFVQLIGKNNTSKVNKLIVN